MHGKWEKNSRPDFKGTIEANCRGKMLFPDHRVFTLEYDPKLKKIFWDGRTSGNVWTKGRFESVFVMSINISESFLAFSADTFKKNTTVTSLYLRLPRNNPAKFVDLQDVSQDVLKTKIVTLKTSRRRLEDMP